MSGGVQCTVCGAGGVAGQRFCHACGAALTDAGDSRVGTTLGHYRVERVIARGGMGVVYQAYDTRLERNVALKLLREDFASDPDFHQRFLRESRAAAALDHQNILPVFDAGEADGVLYIATRLVTGEDLRHRLAHDGSLTLDLALSIVAQVASALDFAHSRGLVHRDVKPANILLVTGGDGEGEHAYLIDFGITKHAETDIGLTATGQFVGTAEYVAPEQVDGQALDGRADQYALACVLFACLTGSPPFAGATTIDVLHAHIHAEPPRAGDLRAGLPPSVDAAISRALSKSPARRFASCRAFVAAVRAGTGFATPASLPKPAAHTVFEQARPVGVAAGEERASGSRVPRAALVAAIVILLAGAGVAAGVLIGGGDGKDRVAATAVTTGGPGTSKTVPLAPPTSSTATTPTTSTTTTTTTPTTTTAPVVPTTTTEPPPTLDAAGVELTKRELSGYTVDLPASWRVKLDDEPQPTRGDVSRSRTEIADAAVGVSIVIDHLDRFDLTASENRRLLDKDHANNKPDYQRIGFDGYQIGGLSAVEWRYSFRSTAGKTARRVDVMLGTPPELFAILAGGRASYDDLAVLARRVAESITPTGGDVGGTPPAPVAAPESGSYNGVALQKGTNPDDYRIDMTFSASSASIDYPDLGCSGTLESDGIAGKRHVYRERITSGTCAHGGTWKIRALDDGSLTASWSRPAGNYTVSVHLSR